MLIVTFEGKAGIEMRASTDRGDPDFRERRSVLDAHVFFFRHRSFPPHVHRPHHSTPAGANMRQLRVPFAGK